MSILLIVIVCEVTKDNSDQREIVGETDRAAWQFGYFGKKLGFVKESKLERLSIAGAWRQGCDGYSLFDEFPRNWNGLKPSNGPPLFCQIMEINKLNRWVVEKVRWYGLNLLARSGSIPGDKCRALEKVA